MFNRAAREVGLVAAWRSNVLAAAGLLEMLAQDLLLIVGDVAEDSEAAFQAWRQSERQDSGPGSNGLGAGVGRRAA